MIHSGMAIADPKTDAGWVSATLALHPHPISRTITDGFPGQETQRDRSSDPEMRRAALGKDGPNSQISKAPTRND